MLGRKMTRLQEYILVIGFSVLYDGEVHPVIVFFLMSVGFPYVER